MFSDRPPLTIAKNGLRTTTKPWPRRYGDGWDRVQSLMAASREERDRQRREQEERTKALLDAQAARAAAAERDAAARAAQAKANRNLSIAFAALFVAAAVAGAVLVYWQSTAAARANMDLATNLWSQLEFKDRSLLPGEAKALWDLTLAKSAVQQAFWSSLGNTKPDQAKELADSSRLLPA